MTNIDDLRGRELDALVAERILGGKLDPTRKSDDGSPFVLHELSKFSEEAAAARGIMLMLEQRHPGILLRQESKFPYRYVVRGPSGREYSGTDDSEATAICRAMLKAMEGEGPGVTTAELRARRGRRMAATVAELLAARTQPHQSINLSSHAIVLQQGEHKEGAARALLEYAATVLHIVPTIAEQAARGQRDIAGMCVWTLDFLAQAGAAARAALPAAKNHPDAEVAKAAGDALDRRG